MSAVEAPDPIADRYRPDAGPVLLSGVQAVVRMLAAVHQRDRLAGSRTASFVSGYQGSPLAGLDRLLAGLVQVRNVHDIRFSAGVNEELAATAVWGSQLPLPGGMTYDGVVGVWYGKAPGVDRAGDALRHGNMMGAHPHGGVLVLAGDDPAAKSSTLPCTSERTLAAYGMPVLYPRNAGEVITFGCYGIALSRLSGCWVGMKLTTDVADGVWSVSPTDLSIVLPELEFDGRPWRYQQLTMPAPPSNLAAEAELVGPRWAAVQAFAAANPVNRIEVEASQARLGVIAAGKTFDDVRQALHDLGASTGQAGQDIRLLRVGMPYPLDRGIVRRFARGLDTILVVEEKQAFVETQVRDILYGSAPAPAVLGKTAADGTALVPASGELTAERLIEPLARGLGMRSAPPAGGSRPTLSVLPVRRTPYFCSGCPHNRSTVVPEGSLVAGGIGCHAMAAMTARPDQAVTGLTQMGGEGAQWIGQAPFSAVRHVFQNMGDGTYFHSGQLAVQAAVAAGVNITFKLLYNGAVAMTGGQDVTAAIGVPELTRQLHAQGVARIVVCAEDPGQYPRGARWAPGVDVWHRDRLDEAQRALRDTAGVTVLIYDQVCAAEARRARRRGALPARTTRVFINERVCEGCGDCGMKSNCLSVQPVETEYGRKTRIDQASCNTDYSCLDGDCPSFITVQDSEPGRPAAPPVPPPVPEPARPAIDGTFNLVVAGIGGTGVVTVNQVLAAAAVRDGLTARALDQTGLSQKAGQVTSHLCLSAGKSPGTNRVGAGQADCLLACDLLAAAEPATLACTAPDRTTTVASTHLVPTGPMIHDARLTYPDPQGLLDRLRNSSRQATTVDASTAAAILAGDAVAANFVLVGAAYQAGALPMSAAAIEWAIDRNRVGAPANRAAFRWGRVAVAEPAALEAALGRPETPGPDERFVLGTPLTGEVRRLVAIRAVDLAGYQGAGLARRYVEDVLSVWTAERAITNGTEFSLGAARGLHRLTAYKDEYEVARLLTAPEAGIALRAAFPHGTRIRMHLRPPVLRALGMRRKIALGPAFVPVLRGLARLRFLRGTYLDPFGYTRIRRIERRLSREYRDLILSLAAGLSADTYRTAAAVAEAAELVRGYEDVKLRAIERYRERIAELLPALPATPN